MKEYRGYTIEPFEGFQLGYKTANGGGGLRKSLGIGTARKCKGYTATGPDGHTFTADTLKEAKRRVDSYLD